MVLTKQKHGKLLRAFRERSDAIKFYLEPLDLESNKEGAGKGFWIRPELMCKTRGSRIDLNLAIGDFEVILKELKKLK